MFSIHVMNAENFKETDITQLAVQRFRISIDAIRTCRFNARPRISLTVGATVKAASHSLHLTGIHQSSSQFRDTFPTFGSTLVLACLFLFSWAHDDKYRFTRVAVLAGGLLYVPMLIMPALNFAVHEQLLLICTAAGSDTVAYFFGMRFGKHKIWPKVSPKKSIEGSIAGLAASVLVAICFGLAFGAADAAISDYALLGVVLGVMAQLGDFFESALKRSRSVKDSGSVLPGHGGVLDRVDSLLFVIPTYECARAVMTFF